MLSIVKSKGFMVNNVDSIVNILRLGGTERVMAVFDTAIGKSFEHSDKADDGMNSASPINKLPASRGGFAVLRVSVAPGVPRVMRCCQSEDSFKLMYGT